MCLDDLRIVLDQLDVGDAIEKGRLEAAYPCLVEVRIPTLPTSLDGLRDALTAFLTSLGLPYAVDGDTVTAYGRETIEITLSDPDRTPADTGRLDRRLADLKRDREWMERRGQTGHECD
jgi:hypothetical protein